MYTVVTGTGWSIGKSGIFFVFERALYIIKCRKSNVQITSYVRIENRCIKFYNSIWVW